MQTERASEPVFAIKTTSRRTLGGNPTTNSISPHSGGSLLTHMCSVHRKSKSTESKGEQTPCLTQQPHHPLSAGQGTQGLTLTPPRLLSISFEECTGFIKPTQTGAPPPPPQTHTLCSSTINTPRQRAAEEKPPEPSSALAGEHREPLSWQGHGEARDKGSSVFGKRYRDSQAHTASFSHLQLEGTAQLRDLRWKAPRKQRWECPCQSQRLQLMDHPIPSQHNCQDLAPRKPTQNGLSTRAKLVASMQPTLGMKGSRKTERTVMWCDFQQRNPSSAQLLLLREGHRWTPGESQLSTAPPAQRGAQVNLRWESTWMHPDQEQDECPAHRSSFHTSCNYTTVLRCKIYITNDQRLSWIWKQKEWFKAFHMSWAFIQFEGFSYPSHKILWQSKYAKKLF